MKESDKYLKIVEWSKEDSCYIGSVPGWLDKCCHGDDETKVYKELCEIVDEWIEIYKKENRALPKATNKEYSGKFVLRTTPEIHKALAISAIKEGTSLNSYVVKKIKRNLKTV
jgi:predicted HicB family RNase H-like nuclease